MIIGFRLTLTSFAVAATWNTCPPPPAILSASRSLRSRSRRRKSRWPSPTARPRLTLTSFAVAATARSLARRRDRAPASRSLRSRSRRLVPLRRPRHRRLPPHAHFVRGRGDTAFLPHHVLSTIRLTLTSFAVAATGDGRLTRPAFAPPHAHFVRGRGDTSWTRCIPATASRLTLTSFAVAATAGSRPHGPARRSASRSLRSRSRRRGQPCLEPGHLAPPHAHFVRGRGDSTTPDRQ